MDRFDNCFDICENIIKMDPGNAGAYEIKGDLYKTHRLIDEAMYQYSKAVELNPASSSGFSSVGEIYKMQGKLNEALLHY